MQNIIWTKGIVLGIIMLFILLSSTPGIVGKENKNINLTKEIIEKQNICDKQKQPLGILQRWFLYAKINITIYTKCHFIYEPREDYFFNMAIITKISMGQTPVATIKAEPKLLPPFEINYYTGFSCNIIKLINPKTNLTTPVDPDGGYIEGDAILLHIPRK
jgi:hypothetical protein